MPVFIKREKYQIIPKGWRRVRLGETILSDKEYKIATCEWSLLPNSDIWEDYSYKIVGQRIPYYYRPIIIKK